MHESVGHPTELDRVYGTEAAYAGTSFLQPSDLGSLRYGSQHMNVTADATTPRGLGTFGFDDEGVPRRASRSSPKACCAGSSVAGDAARSARRRRLDARRRLEPDAARAHDEPPSRARRGRFEELICRRRRRASTSRRTSSWSIDDKRLNFQFGTQIAWEIDDGKLGRMLRDATYTGITPPFWGSLDAVGGPAKSGACTA